MRNVGPNKFGNMIIDNLRKAGIQNRDKSDRLKFDRLEPYAGESIHAAGEFTDKSTERSKRIAVTIGPEHGTVGPDLVKEAAKEAVRASASICSTSVASPLTRTSTRKQNATASSTSRFAA